jgi:hypothetical protein
VRALLVARLRQPLAGLRARTSAQGVSVKKKRGLLYLEPRGERVTQLLIGHHREHVIQLLVRLEQPLLRQNDLWRAR